MSRPGDAGSDAESFRILFVCTGNTCRSPLAELIAMDLLTRKGWGHVEVRSAGTAAGLGSAASGGSLRAAAKNGLDLSSHRSQPLTRDLVSWADLVLTMSAHHAQSTIALGGSGRVTMMSAFVSEDQDEEPSGIPDPFAGPDEQYEETFDILNALIEKTLSRLEPILAP